LIFHENRSFLFKIPKTFKLLFFFFVYVLELVASKEDYAFVFVVALVLTSLRSWVQNYLTEVRHFKSETKKKKNDIIL